MMRLIIGGMVTAGK